MAENEAGVAEQDQETEKFAYPIVVESVGPAAKKVTVEIPRDRITAKMDEQYKELRTQAAIPGFRVGHAPRKLLEKKFSKDVKSQVAETLVRESYQQALDKNSLKVIGDPEFDSQEALKLPEEGSLSYSFSVEVQPEFTMPEFAGLLVKKPKITISEQNIDQAMKNLSEQQGTLVPVEDRGVEEGDYLVADVHLKLDGEVVGHQHDAQLVARAGRIGGIQVEDIAAQLAGAKPGETRTLSIKAPDTHANEKIRGKDVQIEVALKDIKRLELAQITPQFLEDLGFVTEQELRDALREQMDEKITSDIQQAMREQVNRFLLDNITMELPVKMSSRQADRVVSRRALDLMQRGMPREQIEGNIERLRAGAADEGNRELKLFFILQKIADDMKVDVSEAELNGRVALLAAQRDMRPEKLKQQLLKENTLGDLFVQMREQKAIDALLERAKIEEVEMTAQQGEAAAAPASSDAPAGEAPAGEAPAGDASAAEAAAPSEQPQG